MMKILDTNMYVKEHEKQGEIPNFFKVAKSVMKIVWPAMVEGFLVALVSMFDGIQVAGLGNSATASITITKQPIFLMICVITALNIAATAIVSRRKGALDSESANKTVHSAIILSFLLSIVLTIIIFFSSNTINKLMGAQSDTIDFANDYLRIIALGFVFNALRLTINACQRGVGNTKVSMYTNVIANVVNVMFNYLLISGKFGFPRLEVKGAAIATVLGNFVAFVISLIVLMKSDEYLRLKFSRLFHFDKESLKGILNLFPSTMFEQAVMRIGFILFALIVNYLGTSASYVHGVCVDINSLMFTLADGFAIGTAAVVGHKLGEKRKDLAVVYSKVSIVLSVCCALVLSTIMVTLRETLILLYKPETPELLEKAKLLLLIAGVCAIPQNIAWNITSILRGAGDTKFTATVSLICVTFLRPIISFILCYLTPLGIIGAWIGMFMDQFVRLISNIFRFKSRVWLHKKV